MIIRMKIRCAYKTVENSMDSKHGPLMNLLQQAFGFTSLGATREFARLTNNNSERRCDGGITVEVSAEQFAMFHVLRKRDHLQQQIEWFSAEIVDTNPDKIVDLSDQGIITRKTEGAVGFGDLVKDKSKAA